MGIYCEATFHYLQGAEGSPVVQPVRDARSFDAAFDDCGFTRLDAPSDVVDWTDSEEVDRVHGPEHHELAQAFTGADHVLVYPCIIRSPRMATQVEDYAPIETVHSDFTEDYGKMVTDETRPYRDFLQPILDAAGCTYDDVRSASRLMVLQTWRNTGPVEADFPLAYCDARSVPESRLERILVPEYGGRRLEFEAFVATAPEDADDWYTYPGLRDDEVVALRTYDSERVERELPFWTPHSAFRDPHVPDEPGHARESVEMRALCLWR